MGVKECELWADVFDEKLDDCLAPELFEVVSGEAHAMYTDPYEFFVRTYFMVNQPNILRDLQNL